MVQFTFLGIATSVLYSYRMDNIFHITNSHGQYFREAGEPLKYTKGHIASWSDDKQSWAYYLSAGSIKTYCSYDDGSTKILGYLQQGSTFSQASTAFNHGGRGEMEFFALQDCTIYRVTVPQFWARLQIDQAFSNDFLMMQLRDEMMMVDHIILLGECNLERRFARWLLMMAKFYSIIEQDQIFITTPQTRSEIAAWLSLSRETVGKLVYKFTQAHHIELKQKRLKICNLQQLEQLV